MGPALATCTHHAPAPFTVLVVPDLPLDLLWRSPSKRPGRPHILRRLSRLFRTSTPPEPSWGNHEDEETQAQQKKLEY